ncbi:uncharacterized protein C16orf46 homolog [Fundulus heteroclitus]|uniref:uncharacterized protein C16orf46 homolog n=1 Tax=Fundulus heteroclitus TaxID=8078 RepID=UPI00165AE5D9|nr:uncharacterized protein C16orf46 homolog [Fundulus heteroclitus]
MEKQQEDDQAAMSRETRVSDLHETPERKHTDVLLDFSEESFMGEQQPYESHCYSGWEHAVQGWARVSPMSCITMNQKSQGKAKQKEAANPASSKAGRPASLEEQRCKSRAGLFDVRDAGSSNHQLGTWVPTEWPVHSATQNYLPGSFLDGKTEKKRMPPGTTLTPRHLSSPSSLLESGTLKAQKHNIKRDVTVVPIRNIRFLPPINLRQTKPRVKTRVCRGKKTPDENTLYKLENIIRESRTRLDIEAHADLPVDSTATTYRQQACQRSPHLFPAVCISVPDTEHPTRPRIPLGKNISRAMVQHLAPTRCLFT